MTTETGTLAELNVKPGDVVECVGWSDGCNFLVGKQYTIMEKHPKGYFGDLCAVRDGGWTPVSKEEQPMMMFRTVSRATPKTWDEMTDEEQGALLLAEHRGEVLEWIDPCDTNDDWDTKGLCLGCPDMAYRVRPPEPKRETITLYGADRATKGRSWSFIGRGDDATHRITFDVIDGKPDCASIRMEEL